MAKPANMWECPKCGDYVENSRNTCPNCTRIRNDDMTPPKFYTPSPVKNSNVTQPEVYTPSSVKNSNSKTEEKWLIEPTIDYKGSWAAKFLKVIAIILFIGGLIVSYTTANIEVVGKYGSHNEFRWEIFIETYLIYGLAGCFTLCACELFENIQRIADSLLRLEVRKK